MDKLKAMFTDAGRKHLLAVLGVAIILLNRSLHLGLTPEDIYPMAGILGFYFLGEGASDLGEKLGIHVKELLAKVLGNKLGTPPETPPKP